MTVKEQVVKLLSTAKPACGACKFCIPLDGWNGQVKCRRYPPETGANGVFPTVHKTDWCGEFVPRTDRPA